MKITKRILWTLLAAVLLVGLCGCSEPANEPQDEGNDIITTPPEAIYGTWYPMLDVSEVPVEVHKDGTCVVNGENWNWVTKSVEQDTVVLTVGEGEEQFEIEFKYLTSDVPILAEKYCGWSVKQKEIWSYLGHWRNENTGNSFTLTLFAMTQAGCRIKLESGMMTVEVLEGEKAGYVLQVTDAQCIVRDTAGNSTVYVPWHDGMETP